MNLIAGYLLGDLDEDVYVRKFAKSGLKAQERKVWKRSQVKC